MKIQFENVKGNYTINKLYTIFNDGTILNNEGEKENIPKYVISLRDILQDQKQAIYRSIKNILIKK